MIPLDPTQLDFVQLNNLLTAMSCFALVVALSLMLVKRTTRALENLAKLTRELREVVRPSRKKVYKVIERRAGLGTDGQPPMDSEDMRQLADADWRLIAMTSDPSGLQYVWEKDLMDE